MEKGEVVLTFSELDPNLDVKCSKLRLRDSLGEMGRFLDDSDATQNGNEILCDFDKKEATIDDNVDSKESESFLSVDSGSGIFFQLKEFVTDWVSLNPKVSLHRRSKRAVGVNSSVVSFDMFDLNTGRVVMVFSEQVDSPDVSIPNNLVFQETATGGAIYTLTTTTCGTCTTFDNSTNQTTISFRLSTDDLNGLKSVENLCTNQSNCFPAHTGAFLRDADGDYLNPYDPADAAIYTSVTFTPDSDPPNIDSFVLDLNTNEILLTFDEPIRADTIDLSKLTLTNNAGGDIVLTDSTIDPSTGLALEVTLALGSNDITALKTNSTIGTSTTDTNITADANAFSDRMGLNNTAGMLAASSVTPDTSDVELSSWSLDMNMGVLQLTFNDVVDSNGDVMRIALGKTSMMEDHYLTDSRITSGNGTIQTIELSASDLLSIRSDPGFAVDNTTVYLFVQASAFGDLRVPARDIRPVTRRTTFSPNQFTPDIQPPSLDSFTLDMNTGVLRLTFDESIDSIDLTYLTIQSSNTTPAIEVPLTGSMMITFADFRRKIDIQLLRADLVKLQEDGGIATTTTNTYLNITTGGANDTAGNSILTDIQQADSVISDMSAPTLDTFTLDMNNGELTLTFNEAVDQTTFDISQLNITDLATMSTVSVSPTISTGSSARRGSMSNIVTVPLSASTVIDLKRKTNLATMDSNTFLLTSAGLIEDTSPMGNVYAGSSVGIGGTLMSDVSGPRFSSFVLNLTDDTIRITFDEPVNITNVNLSSIVLQDSLATPTTNLSLVGSSVLSQDCDTECVLSIKLSTADSRTIRATEGFGTSQADTVITIQEDAVFDYNQNGIAALSPTFAQNVVNDESGPLIDSFNLDINTGLLTLVYPEEVNTSSLDPTYITIQSASNSTGVEVTLTGGTTNNTNLSNTVFITLSREDLNRIKALTGLAVSTTTTFLSLMSPALKDAYGNEVVEVPSTGGIMVDVFVGDTTPPVLESFELRPGPNKSLIVAVIFDETVDASSLTPGSFVIYDDSGNSVSISGTPSTADSSIIEITVTDAVLDTIRSMYPLGVDSNLTFLNASANSVMDMAGYLAAQAFRVPGGNFTADLEPPTATSFTLDMNMGTLAVTFDDDIDITVFNSSEIVIQSSRMSGSAEVRLSGDNGTTINGMVLTITLIEDDLDSIKLNTSLAISDATTFLSFGAIGIEDDGGNVVREVDANNALSNVTFIPDTTQAELKSFSLDLDSGSIILSFDEPMDASSYFGGGVFLADSRRANPSYVQLTGSTLISPVENGRLHTLTLVNNIQDISVSNAGGSLSTSYMYIFNSALQDMNGNPVFLIQPIEAIQAANFTPDTSPPELDSFTLNLDNGRIIYTFTEFVRTDPTSNIWTLTNSNMMFTLNYTLTRGFNGRDSASDTVFMSRTDQDDLKLLGLCLQNANCFVSHPANITMDSAGLLNSERTIANALAVTVIPDSQPPTLSSFSNFNLMEGYFELSFNEPVNGSSLNFTLITFQSANDVTPLASVTLTSGNVLDELTTTLRVNLTEEDLNNIKSEPYVCSRRYNCYIALDADAVKDASGNSISALTGLAATIAGAFTLDRTNPVLENYTLDMNNGTITLSFNEPVNPDNLVPSAATFFSERVNVAGVTLNVTLTGGSPGGEQQDSEIVVLLSDEDLDRLKLTDNLTTSVDNTYLAFSSDFITDAAHPGDPGGNPVVEIFSNSSEKASGFIPDTTPPRLSEFQLDLNEDTMILVFDEPIRVSSILDFGNFAFHSRNMGPSTAQSLSGGTVLNSNVGSRTIRILLTNSDVEQLKLLGMIGNSITDTFLSIKNDTLDDMAGNGLIEIQRFPATEFIDDASRPMLLNFTLDHNTGLLDLYFDDLMNITTFDPTAFRLQNAIRRVGGDSNYFTLMSSDVINTNNSFNVTVQLSDDDFYEIKSRRLLARTPNQAYITMQAFGLDDVDGVDVLAITDGKALKAINITTDIDSPVVTNFDFDVDKGVLNITFDDFVDHTNVNFTDIYIQDGAPASLPGTRISLTGGTAEVGDNKRTLTINLLKSDLNRIKEQPMLATSDTNTYLSIDNGAVLDFFNNPLIGLSDGMAMRVRNFVNDSSPVELEEFEFDLNSGVLRLTMSEVVDRASLNVPAISLQGERNITDPSLSYTLTGSAGVQYDTNDPSIIEITLTNSDLNAIKALRDVASHSGNTYISLDATFVDDLSGNPTQLLPNSSAQRVRVFLRDLTPPQINTYQFDLNTGNLLLYFNETVDVTTFMVSNVTIGDQNVPVSQYQLTGGTFPNSPSEVLNVTLSDFDLDEIKKLEKVAVNNDPMTASISLPTGFILDMAGQPAVGVSQRTADTFTPDTTPPKLNGFTLDLNYGSLLLTFSETVRGSTLDLSQFTIQNETIVSATTAMINFPQSGTTDNDPVLNVTLSKDDYTALQLVRTLGTSVSNTFITYVNHSVTDMAGNDIVGIQTGRQGSVIADENSPYLEDFDLDLGTGILKLIFSETVEIAFLDVELIVLQNATNDTDHTYRLTPSSVVVSQENHTVDVQLSITDANALKLDPFLATQTSGEDTFITFTARLVNDVADNRVVPISSKSAKRVRNFVQDAVGPTLTNFTLDVNQGFILLTFDEAVNESSLAMSRATIYSSPGSSVSVALTDNSNTVLLTTDPIIVKAMLGPNDLDNIKVEALGWNTSNTFISVQRGVIRDLFGNDAFEIVSINAIQADDVVMDVVNPTLLSFDFDLDSGVILMSFDEAVDLNTFNISHFTFLNDAQDSGNRTVISENITNVFKNYTNDPFPERNVYIQMDNSDLNEFKRLLVCRDNQSCFLIFPATAVSDYANLPLNPRLVALADGSLPVSEVTPDTTSPRLVEFTHFDLDNGLVILSFSETIDFGSVDYSHLTLSSRFNNIPGVTSIIPITDGISLNDDNRDYLRFTMVQNDIFSIKMVRTVCRTDLLCWMQLTNNSLVDMFGNPIETHGFLPAFDADFYAQNHSDDTTPPELVSYDLDLNRGKILFTFNEPVDHTTFQPNQLTFQNDANGSVFVNMDGGSVVTSTFSQHIEFDIDNDPRNDPTDLTELKAERTVATAMSNTFISFTSTFVFDTSLAIGSAGNPIEARNSSNGLQVDNYTGDSTPPVLEAFSILDLRGEMGVLVFAFDEPVANETFIPSGFHLQGNAMTGPSFPLTGGVLEYYSNDKTEVQITLSSSDLSTLKLQTSIGTRRSDSFAFIDAGAIKDTSFNNASALSFMSAKMVDTYEPDNTNPRLVNFTLSLDDGEVVLTFNDIMNGGRLEPSDISFQKAFNDSAGSYHLTGPPRSALVGLISNGYVISFNLTPNDLDGIKAIRDLGTSRENTFIEMGATTIQDIAGLDVIAVTTNNALQAMHVYPDVTPPELRSFSFNLGDGTIVLSFSEAVEPNNIVISAISLQNTSNSSMFPTDTHVLQSVTLSSSTPTSRLVLTLSRSDINTIKSLDTMGTNYSDTFLAFTAQAFTDVFNNTIDPRSTEDAFPATMFNLDNTPPTLLNFIFDLDSGVITLNFSESIDISTLRYPGLRIHSGQAPSAATFVLRNGTALVDSGAVVPVELTSDDLNAIKADTGLAYDIDSTYLSIDFNTYRDTSNQMGSAINQAVAMKASQFIPDTNSPFIDMFDFNLGNGIVTLYFNETVDPSTFDPQSLVIQSAPQLSVHSRQLTGGNLVTTTPSVVVEFEMVQEDLDYLKTRIGFATALGDTYLSGNSSTINDTSANPMVQIPLNGGIIASNYTGDFVPPELSNFTLDLNSGEVILTFSEVASSSSLVVSSFTLQDHVSSPTDSVQLSEESIDPPNSDAFIITVHLTEANLNDIKASTTLAVFKQVTYMSVATGAVSDLAGSQIAAVPTSAAVEGIVSPDVIAPELIDFDITLIEEPMMIDLYFNETIQIRTLNLALFALTDGTNVIAALNGTYEITNTPSVRINMTSDFLDTVRVAASSNPQIPFFIDVQTAGVLDTSNNSIATHTNVSVRTRNVDLSPPTLTSVIFDLDSGTLSLSFMNEVLRNDTIMPQLVYLQNSQSTPTANLTLTGASASLASSETIEVFLTVEDLNDIKRDPAFGTSSSDTFVFHADMFVCDVANNCAERLVSGLAVAATVLPDLTRPSVQYFDLNATSGTIKLCYDEPVNVTTVDGRELYLQDSMNYLLGSHIVPLQPLVFIDSVSEGIYECYTFNMTTFFTTVRARSGLATNYGNTFLSLTSGFIQDMSGLFTEEVRKKSGLAVRRLTVDVERPEAVSASLNLTTGYLTLVFDKAVDYTTFNTSVITLVNNTMSGLTFALNSPSLLSAANSIEMIVGISMSDLNEIKSSQLCDTTSNCFVAFPSHLVMDTNRSSVIGRPESNPLPTTVEPDVAGPVLVSFDGIDFVNQTITLSFDEPLGSTFFDATRLTLYDFVNSPSTSHAFTGDAGFTIDGKQVTFNMNPTDLAAVQGNAQLCVSKGSCYLGLASSFVQDLNGNGNVPTQTFIPPNSYLDDAIPPTLDYFGLDMNKGILTLNFSEPVSVIDLQVNQIQIQGAMTVSPSDTSNYHQLTTAQLNTTSADDDLVLFLSSSDFGSLKTSQFAKSVNDTYLMIMAGATQDTVGNMLLGTTIRVSDYVPDTSAPMVDSFTFDANDDEIVIEFDEPVLLSSLNVTGITLDLSSTPSTSAITLSGGNITNVAMGYATTAVIALLGSDVAFIELNTDFGTNVNNTYLSIAYGSVVDTADIVNNNSGLIQASVVYPDTIRPQLMSFTFEIQNGRLNLTFDDVVNASTFDATAFAMQSARRSVSGDMIQLSNDSYTNSSNGYEIVVQLSIADQVAIRENTRVGTNVPTTWLTMQAFAIDDVFGKDVLAITDGKALQASSVEPDNESPDFVKAVLDLNRGSLILTMTDLLSPSSLLPGSLKLDQLTLSGGVATRLSDGVSVELTLSPSDFDYFVLNSGADFSGGNITFSATSSFVADLAGNLAPKVNATMLASVIPDTTGPSVDSWILDMNQGLLTLTLSEPGLSVPFDPTFITIQAYQNSSGITNQQYRLKSSSVSTGDSSQFVIQLSSEDLDGLQIDTTVATSKLDTFLSIDGSVLMDYFNNSIQNISADSAIQVSSFFRDRNPPRLSSFDLDMNNGSLTLSFSEAVMILDITGFRLQSEMNSLSPTLQSVNLSDSVASTSPASVHVVTLGRSDLDNIQLMDKLAVSNTTSFLYIVASAVSDTSGTNIASGVQRVSQYTADTTPPTLESYMLDLDTGILNLTFSEVVRISSFNSSLFSVSVSGSSASLNDSSIDTGDAATVDITLSFEDENAIKEVVYGNGGVVLLEFGSGAVNDMAGNPIVNMSGISPTVYSPDITRPSVETFNLDTSTRSIELIFDEYVEHSTFDVTTVMMSETQTVGMGGFFGLTLASNVTSTRGERVMIEIGYTDFIILSSKPPLGSNPNSTFLVLGSEATRDLAGNPSFAIRQPQALPVNQLIPDQDRPRLDAFELDFDQGALLLTFNEIINDQGFDATGLTLYSTQTPQSGRLTHRLSSTSTGAIYGSNRINVAVTLATEDHNDITRMRGLAEAGNTTYLSIEPKTIIDPSGNMVEEIFSTMALPGRVVPDSSSPMLTNFSFNLDTGEITLTFNETVEPETADVLSIFLYYNPSSSSPNVQLNGSVSSIARGLTIVVDIDENIVNDMKSEGICSRNDSTCYVAIMDTAVNDTFDNPVIPVLAEDAVLVSEFTPDITSPSLSSFAELDLNQGLVTLSFSETVIQSSFDLTKLSFQDNFASTARSVFTLTEGYLVTMMNSDVITIQLGENDLNSIKADTDLCTNAFTCWIKIGNGFALDIAGLPVVPIGNVSSFAQALGSDLQNFIPDTTRPNCTMFEIDIQASTLTLTFDETVSVSSLDPQHLTIQDSPSGSNSHSLIGGTRITMDNSPVITFRLLVPDLTSIKANLELATGVSDSWISFSRSLITDTNGNDVFPRENSSLVLVATNYTADIASPTLTQFEEFDFTLKTVTLLFSEPVNETSLDFSGITFVSSRTGAHMYTLESGTVLSTALDRTQVTFRLTAEDIKGIKLLYPNLGTSSGNTWIFINETTIKDTAGNSVVGVSMATARQVVNYIPDVRSPELESYSLDLNLGQLTMTFSDVMDHLTINPAGFSIQNTETSADPDYVAVTLSGGMSGGPKDYYITFNLSDSSLNDIKAIRALGTEVNNTFLALQASAIQSVATINVITITDTSALIAVNVTPDTTPPEIKMFTFNVSTGLLKITFTEVVNVTSLMPTKLTLQDHQTSPTNSRTLTGGTRGTSDPTAVLELTLDVTDLNYIKRFDNFGTFPNNTFLAAQLGSVADMSGNDLVEEPTTFAVMATSVLEDVTPPELESFDLDMNTGTLTLMFSETVTIGSVDVTKFILQGGALASGSQYYMLTASSTVSTSDHSNVVLISLANSDLNALKANPEIAYDMNNTYLRFNNEAVCDRNNKCIIGLMNGDATRVNSYVPDGNNPNLDSFDVDLGDGTLIFKFNETVNASSFIPAAFLLMNTPNARTALYQLNLTGGMPLSSHGNTIRYQLSGNDINFIKTEIQFFTTEANSFIAVMQGGVSDMQGNPLVEIPTNDGIRAGTLTLDNVEPVLNEFVLDLDANSLILTFSEPVKGTTLDVSAITLYSSNNTLMQSYPLRSTGSTVTPDIGYILTVELATEDSNNLKADSTIAATKQNTFLTIAADGVTDNAEQNISAITVPIQATSVIKDMTSPYLISFSLSMMGGVPPVYLTLEFSETVLLSSLQVNQLTLQNTSDGSGISYMLQNSQVDGSGGDSATVTIEISTSDLLELRRRPTIGQYLNTTFLSYPVTMVTDTANQPVISSNTTSAKIADVITDFIPPKLVHFTFDLDQLTVRLTFDEDVNSTTLDIANVVIQNSDGSNSTTIGNSTVDETFGQVVVVRLSSSDAITLKSSSGLADDNTTTFISLSDGIIEDIAGNEFIMAIRQVDEFIPDTTSPEIVTFDLDFDQMTITLSFDEPININTLDVRHLRIVNMQAFFPVLRVCSNQLHQCRNQQSGYRPNVLSC